jgi:DNA replication protein DnaC
MSMHDQIRLIAHELRLFGIHEHFSRRTEEAIAQNLHPSDFLRLLLEDEKQYRRNITAKRLITKAKFRHGADLEDWDQTIERGLSKQKLKDLACHGFYHNKENLLIYGKTGEGKTHLAISLGKRLCQGGIASYFFSVNLLFEEVAAEKASGRYLEFIRRTSKAGVIILDDFGLRNYTHEEATILLDIIEARYQKGSIIVTSQVDAKGWDRLFEDAVIKEAIVNRLIFPSQSITLNGGSYRKKLGGGKN